MARSEARVFTDVWDDGDWCSLSRGERDTYVLLLTQEDLAHCGVIPLREGKWARKARVSVDEISGDLKALEAVGWVVIDHETRELLVRSLIRRDKVLRQPKLWVPLAASIKQVDSVHIRSALLAELVRTRSEGGVNKGIAGALDSLIGLMERQLDSLSTSHPDSLSNGHGGTESVSHPHSLQGIGARYVGNQTGAPSPLPLAPSPAPGAGPASDEPPGPDPAIANAEGEGDSPEALADEIRLLRPDWSRRSILRVLSDPDVADRPWALIRAAALTVAGDKDSQHPGRLAKDGPWWYRRGPIQAPPPKPPWCGHCDQDTRLTDDDHPRRCPECHPLREAI